MTKITEKKKVRFKAYEQNQAINLPVLLEDCVRDNALARIIDKLVESQDMDELSKYYWAQGRPPYHPKMLLKVWCYGYCTGVYTSRRVAWKLREDLAFMWLAGAQQPCFKTLSDFRSNRMRDLVEVLFKAMLEYLVEGGYVDINDLYIDGSKFEANANRYSAVWRKNTERYEGQVRERIEVLLEQIEELQKQEDAAYGSRDLGLRRSAGEIEIVLTSSDLGSYIERLEDVVSQEVDKKRQKQLKGLSKKLSQEQDKLAKYEGQHAILDGRNSYSKTDEDATFMRMKDDSLRAAYNTQITTSGGFILTATIHCNGSDSPTLEPHLGELTTNMTGLTQTQWNPDITLDAGYGSEENFALTEGRQMTVYMKYPLWYQEYTGKLAKKKYHSYNWPYNEQGDYYTCPGGKRVIFQQEFIQPTQTGYERLVRRYECESCLDCPWFKACRHEKAKPKSNRSVQISRKMEGYKAQAKERLTSEKGIQKRKQRSVDVETPFGNMKHNLGYRRFLLRGSPKVSVEFKLLCIAQNLRKIHCRETGMWSQYYAQRAAKRAEKSKKRA